MKFQRGCGRGNRLERFSAGVGPQAAMRLKMAHFQPECSCTANLPCNFQKRNFQATGPGGYPSIPEAETMVGRPNLVRNGHIPPSSCLKTAFACILLHLRACKKSKNAPPTSENRAKKIQTIQALAQRLANEQSSYARAALGPFRGDVCWRLFSLFPLSPLPSFSFLSLAPLSSSLRFVFKNRFGERAARTAATQTAWGASKINLWAVDACEVSLLRSEAPKPVFW